MKFKRMMSVACCAASIALMAAACGGEEEGECADGQTLAAVGNGPQQCYDPCNMGMCAAGFNCMQGLCIEAGANNDSNTTNGGSNNTTSNNSNNSTSNNSNNSMSNNSNNSMTNNTNMGGCNSALNIGTCEPLCEDTGCMDGQACAIGSATANDPLMAQCIPAGPGGTGDSCDQNNLCQAGFVCAQDPDGGGNLCQELCDPNSPNCSDANATCGALAQDQRIGVCVVPEDACEPLNDMCPDGEKCAETTLGLQCFPTAGGQVGTDCSNPSQTMAPCDKGLGCIQLDTNGDGMADETSCQMLCDPNDGSRCMNGTTCMASAADPTLGICL